MDKCVIKCGKLLNSVDEQLKSNQYVYIEEGVITTISEELKKGYKVIDYSNFTVMPGMINCHTHICLEPIANSDDFLLNSIPKNTLRAAENAKKYLYSGVTTIRDLGGVNQIDIEVRNSIRDGLIKGPEMFVAGQFLTMTGGHGYSMGMECDGVTECQKAARTQLKRGADIIKFMATGGVLTKGVEPGSPQLSQEEMTVMVNEAHHKNKKTASHAQGDIGIQNAIRAGVDSIEHGFYMSEETVEMMAEYNVFYVPTISPPYFIIKNGVEANIPEEFVRKAKESIEAHKRSFKMCLEKGVKIVAGTDGGTPFNLHENTYFEVKLLVDYGMTQFEAIVAVTKSAAACLGLNDRGTIEVGKRADIIAIKGNPLEDILCLNNVAGVIKQGQQL